MKVKSINDCVSEESVNFSFTTKEKNKSFTLASDTIFHCTVVNIDKCCFTGVDLRRCDFLFLVANKKEENKRFENSKALYIELKGDDIKSACEQLFNAIDRTKSEISNFQIEAKVIGTKGRQPNILTNEFYRKVKKIIKKEIQFHKVGKYNGYNYTENI